MSPILKAARLGLRQRIWPVVLLSAAAVLALMGASSVGQSASAHSSAKAPAHLFKDPFGIALDSKGNIYVTDDLLNRVVKLSPAGKVLAKWGKHGSGTGQFDSPMGVAIGPGGRVVVVDQNNSRLEQFTAAGKFISTCCQGSAAVGTDLRGSYYIATSDPNYLNRYSASGKVTGHWKTLSPPNFSYPRFIAGDAQGDVYVTFSDDNEVQKFSPNGKSVVWKLKGSPHYTPHASGVAVDNQNNVYVADDQVNTITKLTPSGKVLGTWNSVRGQVTDKGNFDAPEGIVVDQQRALYVADAMNSRIQKLSSARKVLAVFK